MFIFCFVYKISNKLIESIFYKNSPLHDGAIIISDGLIMAAHCVLPLTEKTNLPITFGLRHRAAIGITERSDCFAIIVSEQTGEISCCINGEFILNVHPADLKNILTREFIK